jgi:hypothetical protein
MNRFGFGGVTDVNYGSATASFTRFDKTHPLFEGVFKTEGQANESTESPAIDHALPAHGGQFIIEIPGGGFLSESALGDGEMIYCAVPPTADWSNFPFTGIFPTITHRSVSFLVSPRDFAVNVTSGNSINLTLPKKLSGGGTYRITDPDGSENVRTAIVFPSGATISLSRLEITGNYLIGI